MKKINFLGIACLTSLLLVGCATQKQNTIESTKKENNTIGKVKGIKKDSTYIWYGIPYGADTSGENRWHAPKDPEKWQSTLDRTKPGDVALQASSKGVIGSENALNLDVYRPDNSKDKLPVLVYIHGGNNQTGQAQEISGQSFVKSHDAIYISVNYRLGVLGFNPLPSLQKGTDEENSGNYTLLDIKHSLDWIKDNISNFGGDAENITVSGFSAGGDAGDSQNDRLYSLSQPGNWNSGGGRPRLSDHGERAGRTGCPGRRTGSDEGVIPQPDGAGGTADPGKQAYDYGDVPRSADSADRADDLYRDFKKR